MLFGGIEAGGTKFVCAVGDQNGNIIQKVRIPTTVPEETMGRVMDFFKAFELVAIGVGSFGPIDVDRGSATYGCITTTPKVAWRQYPIVRTLQEAFHIPVGFHTDVNAAALGEATYGAAKGLDSCLYVTIGTGIGAGAIVGGKLLEGLSHPEMGHTVVRRHPEDLYRGRCPYHADCLEGLAAGPALKERWGAEGAALADRSEVWEMEGYYIAQALLQYILILSPKRIVLGGGVMGQKQLFPHIFKHVEALLSGYVKLPALESYIVPPALEDPGVIGSLLIAEQAYKKEYTSIVS
ncbi:ROK family protein [Ectobacillus sp. JY-23]|uniref:ROK family protein n=1 Tax=Ectobacillus sp. JY-23 TaxID=2933872 RepID=UPI001FF3AE3F|nr:ROK family protein [Ectobacillus sp. JY-23]UOY92241.1 ROK family protein [Ectobacillus sp. JY-23]